MWQQCPNLGEAETGTCVANVWVSVKRIICPSEMSVRRAPNVLSDARIKSDAKTACLAAAVQNSCCRHVQSLDQMAPELWEETWG